MICKFQFSWIIILPPSLSPCPVPQLYKLISDTFVESDMTTLVSEETSPCRSVLLIAVTQVPLSEDFLSHDKIILESIPEYSTSTNMQAALECHESLPLPNM